MNKVIVWLPAVLLLAGVGLTRGVGRQQRVPLATPLSTVPGVLEGFPSRDLTIPEDQRRVAGMDTYLSRVYGSDSADAFTIYVGYYESQAQGRTIHSPKNCLPGAGWEPMSAREDRLETSSGPVPVNRYLLGKKSARAIVYYWYQGRGRVSANEYKVKLELIRDAAFRKRTDEALVRVVVPVQETEEKADSLARRVARELVPILGRILPS